MDSQEFSIQGEPMRLTDPLGSRGPAIYRDLAAADFEAARGEGPEQDYGEVVVMSNTWEGDKSRLVYNNYLVIHGPFVGDQIMGVLRQAVTGQRRITVSVESPVDVRRILAVARKILGGPELPTEIKPLYARVRLVTDGMIIRVTEITGEHLVN